MSRSGPGSSPLETLAMELVRSRAPSPRLASGRAGRSGVPGRHAGGGPVTSLACPDDGPAREPDAEAVPAQQPPPPPAPGPAPDVVELVTRAQAGDAEAFGQLYDRYVTLIYRYVYYRVGSQQLAEDLTSETFLRALRRLSSFSWQGRDVGAWFVTIARNLIFDHFKSSRYRLEVSTADMLGTADAAGDTTPESEVLDALTNATLLEAVRKLGAEQQECIVLRFLQGLSVSETALAMGKNEGAIKALQYRAVRALGRLLPDAAF